MTLFTPIPTIDEESLFREKLTQLAVYFCTAYILFQAGREYFMHGDLPLLEMLYLSVFTFLSILLRFFKPITKFVPPIVIVAAALSFLVVINHGKFYSIPIIWYGAVIAYATFVIPRNYVLVLTLWILGCIFYIHLNDTHQTITPYFNHTDLSQKVLFLEIILIPCILLYLLGRAVEATIIQMYEHQNKLQIDKQAYIAEVSAIAKEIEVGEIAGGIAHEINNPLQVISGCTSLIKAFANSSNPDMDKVHDLVARMKNARERIDKITQGIAASFQEEKNLDSSFDLCKVCTEVVSSVQYLEKADGINLRIHLQKKKLVVPGNSTQIHQVLINLINNALDSIIEFSPPKREIVIKVSSIDRIAVVHILDTGPGIPEGFDNKIFQPFFTTKPVGVGTGLGLSIVSGIIKAHRGEIYVEREKELPGFTFTIPLTYSSES